MILALHADDVLHCLSTGGHFKDTILSVKIISDKGFKKAFFSGLRVESQLKQC